MNKMEASPWSEAQCGENGMKGSRHVFMFQWFLENQGPLHPMDQVRNWGSERVTPSSKSHSYIARHHTSQPEP